MKKNLLLAFLMAFGAFLLLSGCNDGLSETIVCTSDEECMVKGYDYCGSTGYCETIGQEDGDSTADGDDDGLADGDCEDGNCVDGDFSEYDKPYQYPRMTLTPSHLDFGAITYMTSDKKTFKIQNTSNFDTDLIIQQIVISTETTDEFSITNMPELPATIQQNGEIEIEVTYESQNIGCDETYISIVSNAGDDLNNPTTIVRYDVFTLCKGVKRINIVEKDNNFGESMLGEQKTIQVMVTNECPEETTNLDCPDGGNQVLTITEVVAANDETLSNFDIIETVIPQAYDPIFLPPTPGIEEGQYLITIAYKPSEPSDVFNPHIGKFYVINDSDEPDERIGEINVRGYANHDTIEVLPNPIDFGKVYMNCDDQGVVNGTCNVDTTCETDEDCPKNQVCRYDKDALKNYCFKNIREDGAKVYNYSEEPIAITNVLITSETGNDSDCNNFSIDKDTQTLAGQDCETDADCQDSQLMCIQIDPDDQSGNADKACYLRPNGTNFGVIDVFYRPTKVEENKDRCNLTLKALDRNQNVLIKDKKLVAVGSLPNQQPVARVSRQSHGQKIETELTVYQDDSRVFYGNISYDADGYLTDFSWQLTMPDGSSQFPNSSNIIKVGDDYTVMATFTAPGEHVLSLVVTDNEGLKSEAFEVVINVIGAQGLDIRLDFDDGGNGIPVLSSNIVDMDLYATSPDFFTCSDDSLTANRTCRLLSGGIMPNSTNGAGTGTTYERFVMKEPKDGMWCFGVQYVNDCEDWVDLLIRPFCASRHSPANFSLEIYDPNNTEVHSIPWWTYDGSIRGGATKEWCMYRVEGIFTEPEPR